MTPWVLAFSTIAPLAFLAGFLIRPFFSRKDNPMAVYAEVQASLDALNTAVSELPAKVAAAVAAGDPVTAQDKADTVAAVQASLGAAVTAIDAVGPQA